MTPEEHAEREAFFAAIRARTAENRRQNMIIRRERQAGGVLENRVDETNPLIDTI